MAGRLDGTVRALYPYSSGFLDVTPRGWREVETRDLRATARSGATFQDGADLWGVTTAAVVRS